MSRLLKRLLTATLAFTIFNVYAATSSTDNADDASKIGTEESPQVQQQQNRTDKGPTGVNQGTPQDDASNLGTEETPQIQKQQKRSNKGASEPVDRTPKNKVMRKKLENHGTSKGNTVQPAVPQEAAPKSDAQSN